MTFQTSLALTALAQRFVAWLALVMTVGITACGPGTGGTGVGPTAGTYISLNSITGSPSVVGTATSSATQVDYMLVLDPAAIRLTGACLAFSSEGAWMASNGEIRVTGSYRQAAPSSDLALAAPQAGTLIARADNAGFSVRLLDERGAPLLSFTTGAKLAEGVAAVPVQACQSLPAVAAA